MTECPEIERTHALADGELTGEAAHSAREHIAVCAQCQAELADVLQLAALPAPRSREMGGIVSLAWYRRRSVVTAAAAMGVAAGVTLYLAVSHRGDTTSADVPRVAIALAPNRSIEARLGWSGAADYRTYSIQRAGDAGRETIQLEAMAAAERRGDFHGVGALALLNGNRAQAASFLSRVADSPAVLTDRAALALVDGDPAAALALADEALSRGPRGDEAGGRTSAAMWNRGLALRDLGLSSGAAAAFRSVAANAEPGWADEAKQRAAALEAEVARTLDVSAARAICNSSGLNDRCVKLTLPTGQIDWESHRLPEAKKALDEAWRRARASGQWAYQNELLFQFAHLAAGEGTGAHLSSVRAYAEELVDRYQLMAARGYIETACLVEVWAREVIALVQMSQYRLGEAAERIARPSECAASPALTTLLVRAQVAQFTGPRTSLRSSNDRIQRDIAAALRDVRQRWMAR